MFKSILEHIMKNKFNYLVIGLGTQGKKRSKIDKVVTKNFHYDVKEVGYKYNLTDINSAIGLIQLKKIEKNYKKRELLFNEYKKNLDHFIIKIMEKLFYEKKNFNNR